MTPKQQKLQNRRLELEEELWKIQRQLFDISAACAEHVVIDGRVLYSPTKETVVNTHEGLPEDWNDGCYSVSCAVCGKQLGWHCPVNPKGYCEYDEENGEDCIHCHIPQERK